MIFRTKYLSMLAFLTKLTWDYHIEMICIKVGSEIAIKSYVSFESLQIMYVTTLFYNLYFDCSILRTMAYGKRIVECWEV